MSAPDPIGRAGWLVALGCGVLAAILYANAIANPFISDDELAISGNPMVRTPTLRGLVALWTLDYWHAVDADGVRVELADDPNLYRPVTVASYWLNARVTGAEPGAFRAVNLGLHVLAACLIGLVCARACRWRAAGAVTALVVVAHPLATDVVNRIVGRADVLVLIGVAGVLLVQQRARVAGWSWPRAAAAALAAAIALGAKESGLVMVPLAAVHEWIGRRTPGASPTHGWRGVLALGLPLALYLAGRTAAVGLAYYPRELTWDLGANPLIATDLAIRLPASAALLWDYAVRMVWPWPLLAFDVPRRLPVWSDVEVWLGLALGAVLTAALLRSLVRRRPMAVALAWWLGAFLVVGHLVLPVGAYREVRFAYSMLGGFALALGLLVDTLARAMGGRAAWAVAGIALVLALAAAPAVVARNRDFQSLEALLLADVRERPGSAAALIRLANVREQQGRIDDAGALYERVTALAPRSAQAWYEYGHFHGKRGRPDRQRAALERALAANPSHFLAAMELGNVALNAGDLATADRHLSRAAALAPDDPWVSYNLAVLDEHRGNRAAAIRRLEELVRRRPDFTLGVQALATLRASEAQRPQRSTR